MTSNILKGLDLHRYTGGVYKVIGTGSLINYPEKKWLYIKNYMGLLL